MRRGCSFRRLVVARRVRYTGATSRQERGVSRRGAAWCGTRHVFMIPSKASFFDAGLRGQRRRRNEQQRA